MQNILFDELKEDEKTEAHEVTKGDSLLGQFTVGNWSWSVAYMIKENISAMDLINYIEDVESYMGSPDLTCEFDRSFFAELGKTKVRFN